LAYDNDMGVSLLFTCSLGSNKQQIEKVKYMFVPEDVKVSYINISDKLPGA